MYYYKLWNEYSAYLKIAFQAGIDDSINPCAVAGALFFVVYLAIVGYTKKRVLFFGLLYLIVAIRVQHTIIAGYWDVWLTLLSVIHAINILYFLLSVGFIILGIMCILDWGMYKKWGKTDCFRINIPAFSLETQEKSTRLGKRDIVKLIAVVLITVFCGILMTLMGAIYPQTEYIYIVSSVRLFG